MDAHSQERQEHRGRGDVSWIFRKPLSAVGSGQAEIDSGGGPAGALTTAEREELAQLRKRVKTLEMEREILKKATAFFAKESK